jgi:hypothetical protein
MAIGEIEIRYMKSLLMIFKNCFCRVNNRIKQINNKYYSNYLPIKGI